MIIGKFFKSKKQSDGTHFKPAHIINSTKKIVKVDVKPSEDDDEDDNSSFLDGWNIFEEEQRKPLFKPEDGEKEDTPKEADKERKEDIIDKSHTFFSSDKFAPEKPLKEQEEKEKEEKEITQNIVLSADVTNPISANIPATQGQRFTKPKGKTGRMR